MKKQVLVTILWLCFGWLALSVHASASGSMGSYTLQGNAKHNGRAIANTELLFKVGRKSYSVFTDSAGNYRFNVLWSTMHGVNVKNREYIRRNPRFIYAVYGGLVLKIRNQWKKSCRHTYQPLKTYRSAVFNSSDCPSFLAFAAGVCPNMEYEQNLRFSFFNTLLVAFKVF